MIIALVLCLISVSAWAFRLSMSILAQGSFAMQTGVQGAFGVIPAHLAELAPDSVRSLFTRLVYHLGMLMASTSITLEYALRHRLGYPWALTTFEASIIVALLALFILGLEKLERDFRQSPEQERAEAILAAAKPAHEN